MLLDMPDTVQDAAWNGRFDDSRIRNNAGLSAGPVTGGFDVINDLVEPLFQQIVLFCQNANSWHADETSWRVFSQNNSNKKTNNWWL